MKADDSLLEAYIYETQQLLGALENTLFSGEHNKQLDNGQINEIFRIMHTIKGSSAMMEFDGMAKLSHVLEDLFSQIRENGAAEERWPDIFDLVFSAISFFNGELAKLLADARPDGEAAELIGLLQRELRLLQTGEGALPEAPAPLAAPATAGPARDLEYTAKVPYYKIKIFFTEDCRMENIRAFGIVQSLQKIKCQLATVPQNLNDNASAEQIKNNGLLVFIQTDENPDTLKAVIEGALFLRSHSILAIDELDEELPEQLRKKSAAANGQPQARAMAKQAENNGADLESVAKQNFISVNVNKLDNLLNIVGEIVTAQSMVINNADFGDLNHDSFDTASQQLRALINELQDIVMNIRMIPMSTLFQKMRRLVREMSKKSGKDVDLELQGEETEVDKNVIDSLSDPLLHIIRNAVDHGVEDPATRQSLGKPASGKILLSAQTKGNDVVVTIADDGQGLQRHAILKKAFEKGLIPKIDEEMPDKDVFAMVFLPGFSTNDEVSEYSGRGVGMDVVRKNISMIGGSVTLESTPGAGTTNIIRIPLTLTIVDGMKFNVGDMHFIVPTSSVHSVSRPDPKDIFTDPDGNEMMMVMGECLSLVRLNEYFDISGGVTEIGEGMLMHISTELKNFCIFFDSLDGERQVVVKKLPNYLNKCSAKLDGISGCSILGDGSINLILDVNRL